jgi:hypothetical protein
VSASALLDNPSAKTIALKNPTSFVFIYALPFCIFFGAFCDRLESFGTVDANRLPEAQLYNFQGLTSLAGLIFCKKYLQSFG